MKSVAVLVASLSLAATMTCQAQNDTNASMTLVNTGFENPSIVGGAQPGAQADKWFFFSSAADQNVGVSDTRKKGGMQSLKFKAQTASNAYDGVAQKFLAKSGGHYTFTVYLMSDPTDPLVGGAYGQISIEWHDNTGKEISRVHGPTWNFELASSNWTKFLVEGDAPENTAAGMAVITFFSQDSNGRGTFYADDCELNSR